MAESFETETQRLLLRRFRDDDQDAAFMLAMANDPSWLKNIGDRGLRSVDDARRYIQQVPLDLAQRP
jgi:ribosomal-protein-alanine N-acetyltransferase